MKTIFFISLLFNLTMLSQTKDSTINFEHVVPIPQEFAIDSDEAGWTTRERYSIGYESGWWHSIYSFQKDINVCFDTVGVIVSGWPSETFGYLNGGIDAGKRISYFISEFGKDKVHKEVLKLTIPDTLHYNVKY